jgi:hypothetical protein
MRLRQFNPANIRVRRGGWGGGLPGGGGGKLGCGAIVITIIAAMVLGVDPSQMLGTIEGLQQGAPGEQTQTTGGSTTEICQQNRYSLESCNGTKFPERNLGAAVARRERPFRAAYSQFLPRRDSLGMRRGIELDGAILLPR